MKRIVEGKVRRGAAQLFATPAERDAIRSDFAHALAETRARLDRRGRAQLVGTNGHRLLAERGVKACGATLDTRVSKHARIEFENSTHVWCLRVGGNLSVLWLSRVSTMERVLESLR